MRWLNHDCACSRLSLAWKNITIAETHSRPAKPIPAPIPAFAPVLRPVVVVDGALSARAVVSVGVAVEGEVEGVALVMFGGAGDDVNVEVEIVVLEEVEVEDVERVPLVLLLLLPLLVLLDELEYEDSESSSSSSSDDVDSGVKVESLSRRKEWDVIRWFLSLQSAW
jgi:hypothetical protein